MSQFDAVNSSEDDFRTLAVGKANYAILLKGTTGGPGSGQIDIADAKKSYVRRDDYSVEVHIFQRYVTDALATRAALTVLADAVEGHFDKYPDLDDFVGIIDSRIDTVPESSEWRFGSGVYFRQIVTITVAELSTVYLAETQAGVIFRWDGATIWDGSGSWG
jgi:hypothetical protein|tara:strand:- start:177 stop:662 length:486 start_codon:yes stop_codon:yes gene_type:complete